MLLLDEPFGALDAQVRKELRTWLRRLHDEVHVTTVFVTHDQEEAMDVADEIVVLADGEVRAGRQTREVYDHPANAVRHALPRSGDHCGRPAGAAARHRTSVLDQGAGSVPVVVTRVVSLGFEVRVEGRTADDEEVWAQLTRARAGELDLRPGDTVHFGATQDARTPVLSLIR